MTMNILDDEGLPQGGIERTLAHHLLGRRNRLAKQVVYALVGPPRRNGELTHLTGGRSDNNLTQALRFLQDEAIVGTVVDVHTRPAAVAYKLTPFGYLVVDWMRRYEWLDELKQPHPDTAPPATT
jgi:DNA-binding HxlR family transcriptional regulator